MGQQILNPGAFSNDPDAEEIRESLVKANSNFDELYAGLNLGGSILSIDQPISMIGATQGEPETKQVADAINARTNDFTIPVGSIPLVSSYLPYIAGDNNTAYVIKNTYILNTGAGTYGANVSSTVLTASNVIKISESIVNPSTALDMADIGATAISTAMNNVSPSKTKLGVTLVTALQSGVQQNYIFDAVDGDYGSGDLQTSSDNFINLNTEPDLSRNISDVTREPFTRAIDVTLGVGDLDRTNVFTQSNASLVVDTDANAFIENGSHFLILFTGTGTHQVVAPSLISFAIVFKQFDLAFVQKIGVDNWVVSKLGETEQSQPELNNIVNVNIASDFGTIDSTKAYIIGDAVDMGSTPIEVPAGGINIMGVTVGVSKLFSSANNYIMFTSPVGGSGGIVIVDTTISVTGTSSQVYDLEDVDGTHIIRLNNTDFVDCTSLGELTGYFTGIETACARFGGSPSLTLSGTWAGGYRQQTCIVAILSSGFTGAVFTEGTTFTMANRFLTDVSCDLPASAAFCDFQPSNFANPSTVVIRDAQFSRNGLFDPNDSNIFTNLVASDLASSWTGNKGIPNTFPGGLMSITTELATTINTINVFELLAGTWTATELQHFDQPSNGQLRHLGDFPVEYNIGTSFIIEGTSGDAITIRLRKFDFSASTTSTLFEETRSINSFQGPQDSAFFNILRNFNLDNQDYIFWEVANGTGTASLTATDASRFLVGPR